MMEKLNLGCGRNIREGWINLDVVENKGVDVVYDLDNPPYPFKDNEFDFILGDMVLEHIIKPEEMIRELWRISKDKAHIKIIVPHFSNWQTWGDITHRRGFTHGSLNSFSPRDINRNAISLLVKQKEIFYIKSKIIFSRIKKILGFELFFNLNNYARGFYEKHLAYIFPAEKIIFNLVAYKTLSANKPEGK